MPAQDRGRLCYRLGRVLYLSGGSLQAAIDYMNRGSPLSGEDAAEGYGLLVEAYLKLPGRDVDAALRVNQKLIDVCDDDAIVARAKVKRGELLLEKGQRAEALKVLDGISRRAPSELQWQARALQARCCQEDGLYSRAALLWRELLAEPVVVLGGRGRVLYMLGSCLELDDPPQTAKAREAFEEATRCGGEEAQAAALRLADSLLGGSHPEAALPHFQFALENVTTTYSNSLIGLDAARELFEHGCAVYRQRHHFLSLQLLAQAYRKIAATGVAEERQAQAAEELGKYLRDKARTTAKPAEVAALLGKAREQFRKAAQAYEASAQALGQSDHLQRLAQCRLSGAGPGLRGGGGAVQAADARRRAGAGPGGGVVRPGQGTASAGRKGHGAGVVSQVH